MVQHTSLAMPSSHSSIAKALVTRYYDVVCSEGNLVAKADNDSVQLYYTVNPSDPGHRDALVAGVLSHAITTICAVLS